MTETLFSGGDLCARTEKLRAEAVAGVSKLDADIVRTDPESAVLAVFDRARLVPIVYDFEQITRSKPIEVVLEGRNFRETFRSPGQAFDIFVPLTGSSELLSDRASQFSMGGAPQATIAQDRLTFRVSGITLTAEEVKSDIASMQSTLERMTAWTNVDIEKFNSELLDALKAAVFARKQRLDNAAAVAGELDIPTN